MSESKENAKPKCPLCKSDLTDYSIDSNHVLLYSGGVCVGVKPGAPSMTAKCARGCHITVVREGPLGENKPAVPADRGEIPPEHQAQSSGALMAGWR